jgi:hypothetical protein
MIDPDKAILTSAIVTLTSTTAGTMLPARLGGKGELPKPKMLIGAAFTFMGLSIIGDIAPKVGVGLAASVAVTALTFYGVPIADTYFTGPTTH